MDARTFGSIELHGTRWMIRGEPQVRARLKRMFPRAPQHASDAILISNTPENCRDLLWFMDRYPLVNAHAEQLERGAAKHVETEARVADLLEQARPGLDIQLAKPPREYQVFAAELLEIKHGLLVADDVGLGKTVTSICSMTLGANRPALVVCPTHLPRQWAEAIAEFAPHLSVHVINKGTPYMLAHGLKAGQKIQLDGMPDVIITNYHKLKGWAETLAGACKLVVFDEAQQLRNPGSDIYAAAVLVASKASRRLGLSATPIYNYGSEFFWVLDVVQPGALGDREEFSREWCRGDMNGKARIADTEQFGAHLRREGIMLRRTRKDVGRELPELTKVVHQVEADESALFQLQGDAIKLAKVVLSHNEQYRGQKMQAAGEFDAMMRQATGIAKAKYVADFVRLLLDSEERVVLFAWHREVYSILLEQLAEFRPLLYTGSESPAQKEAAKRDFVEGRSRILLMSLRSGAGVDGLQGICRTVVFGELDWSPGVHEQCVGRVHRDGQDEACVAYFLHADTGCDPIMLDVLGVKREQIEGVRNPDRALAERVDIGENSIQKLARAFLDRRGIQVTDSETRVLELRESLTSTGSAP